MKDQWVGDDESFDLLVNVAVWAAQANAAVRSDEAAEWSRCEWLMQQWDTVQAKSVARTYKPNNGLDELRRSITEVLLGLAGHEAEEVFARLCAASVLVSWGDERVQPVLEAPATNESYNGRRRTQLLQLALDGNPAAQQWVRPQHAEN